MTNALENPYDVVVIGGGAAGLSAALVLARARRRVVVIDSGEPRNAPAEGVHGFLSRDGIPPRELLAIGRAEVAGYGGEFRAAEARAAQAVDGGFTVTLADGAVIPARRLVVTTGLVDELPDVPGLRERWGRDVLHCPYCHGWEVRDQALGVLGGGPMAVHQALLLRQWSDDVVLFRHTGADLTGEQAGQLAARGIGVVDGTVAGLELGADRITGVRLADGSVVARQALMIGTRVIARSQVLAGLGLAAEEHPMGIGRFVPADPTGRTSVPGVWVAGDVTAMGQVSTAVGAGATAAAAVNGDLVLEDTARAVAGQVAV